MQLTDHFSLSEMTRSDAAIRHGIANTPPAAAIMALREVCIHVLEPVRAHFGKSVRVNSGFRSLVVNRLIGSSDGSQHVKGEAADFEIPGVSNYIIAAWVRDNLHFDQLILEFYRSGVPDSGWVHCSWKPNNRRLQVLTIPNAHKTLAGLVQ